MRRPGRVTIAALMSVSLLKAATGVAQAGDIPAQPTDKKPGQKQQASNTPTQKKQAAKKPRHGTLPWSILFSITADEAQVTPLGGKSYRLTLQNVDERTTWFTDRPVRHAGGTPTARLIAGWDIGRDNFAQDPPNAALVVHEPVGGADTFVMELSNPIYDEANDELTFTGKALFAETEINSAHSSDADPLPTTSTTYSDVSLFIDDASTILFAPAGPTPRADSASPSASPSTTATPAPSGSTAPSPTPSATTAAANVSGTTPSTMSDWSVDQWKFHSIVLSKSEEADRRYISKTRIDLNTTQDAGNFIYSFPATALIANFSDHHLDIASQGITLLPSSVLSTIGN